MSEMTPTERRKLLADIGKRQRQDTFSDGDRAWRDIDFLLDELERVKKEERAAGWDEGYKAGRVHQETCHDREHLGGTWNPKEPENPYSPPCTHA
jgi:hypothetical protein